jgi:hypothetical protein
MGGGVKVEMHVLHARLPAVARGHADRGYFSVGLDHRAACGMTGRSRGPRFVRAANGQEGVVSGGMKNARDDLS